MVHNSSVSVYRQSHDMTGRFQRIHAGSTRTDGTIVASRWRRAWRHHQMKPDLWPYAIHGTIFRADAAPVLTVPNIHLYLDTLTEPGIF
jgi:hypothetical protein